jgi:hypothetical protein
LIGNALRLLAGLISLYILPKALGLAVYGNFQFVNSLIIKFRDTFVSGSEKAMFSRIVNGKEKKGAFLYPIILALLGYLCAYMYVVIEQFETQYFTSLVLLEFVIFTFTIVRYLSDLEGFTKDLQKFWTITIFGKALILLIFFLTFPEPWWINAWLVTTGFLGVVLLIALHRAHKFEFNVPSLRTLKISIVDFQAPIYLSNLLGVYLFGLIGSGLSVIEDNLLGVFMLSLQLNGMFALVTNSLQNALWLGDMSIGASKKRVILFITGLSLISICVIWFAPFILKAFSIIGNDAEQWFVVRLTLATVVPISINQMLSIYFYKMERSKMYNMACTVFIGLSIFIYLNMSQSLENIMWFFLLTNLSTAIIFSVIYVLVKE